MNDDKEQEEECTLSDKHKRELKELRAQIQQIKKNTPKGDKKRKKDAAEAIATLERELDTRHLAEIARQLSLKDDPKELPIDKEDEGEDGEEAVDDNDLEDQTIHKKPNRQQVRKQKKAQAMQEMRREAELEALNVPRPKDIEDAKISITLEQYNRHIKQVNADGHCMFNAVADQLKLVNNGKEYTYQQLRTLAADYMLQYPDDFLPFLTEHTSETYPEYCEKVRSTALWGGQLELQALSQALEACLNVVQADGPLTIIGEQFKTSPPLWLSYHRHMFGLGEHYNSLVLK